MQFEHSKLKGIIKERGFTQEDVARHINIAPSTFSLKINGTVFFNQDEIQHMAEFLKIPDVHYKAYFFTVKV